MGIIDGVKNSRPNNQRAQIEERLTKNRERVQEERIAALDDDNTTFHREKALDDAFDRQVSEGRQRLARPRPQQFITGVMGGMEISLGILIGMRVTDLSGSQLLGGVAFSLGFITLLLAHSELFTEGFLVPTSAVVARRARILQLVRFWFYTFLGNLVGGFVVMWATTTAFPDSNDVLIHHGEHFASLTPDLKTVLMAIIAGTAITLMTRMQMGTSEVIGKIVAALFGGILLFGFGMLHSVLDTLIMLGAWCAGASVTSLDILGFLWWVIPLNMFGGIVCVAMPRALQARDRVRMERIRVSLEMHNGDELANDARGLLISGHDLREELQKELEETSGETVPNGPWQDLGNRISARFTRLGNRLGSPDEQRRQSRRRQAEMDRRAKLTEETMATRSRERQETQTRADNASSSSSASGSKGEGSSRKGDGSSRKHEGHMRKGDESSRKGDGPAATLSERGILHHGRGGGHGRKSSSSDTGGRIDPPLPR